MTEAAARPHEARRAGPDVPVFVGTVDLSDLTMAVEVDPRYRTARLLLTVGCRALGVVEVRVDGGRIDPDEIRAAARGLVSPDPHPRPTPARTTDLTVAVCTRNRAAHLARCLAALREVGDPGLSILVVDNGSDEPAAADAARTVAHADRRVRLVREPRVGLSAARNRALAEVDTPWVAFVDDDVRVEPGWLAALLRAVGTDEGRGSPACVTGPVLSAELETPEQLASDRALGWSRGFRRRRFGLGSPSDSAIFPFSVGEYGMGANVAVDVAVARELGGFDERLGAGSPTRGGEDIDLFVRLIVAGREILYEPDAYVWHHHRVHADEFRRQVVAYGMGLGAFLAKVCLDPVLRPLALRRVGGALVRVRELRGRMVGARVGAGLRWSHAAAVVPGAVAFVRLGREAPRRSTRPC